MSDGLPGNSRSDSRQRPAFQSGHRWLIGALLAVIVLLALAGDDARRWFRYERAAVFAGEYWRLITGHIVHGNLWHAILNLAGLALIASLFGRDYSPRQWLCIAGLSALAIDIAFVCCQPQLEWYVGLSGVLHGLIAAGVFAWFRYENRYLTLALAALLLLKLAWEQWQGALPFSGDMPVIVDAHLYGAIGGGLTGLVIWLREREWRRRA